MYFITLVRLEQPQTVLQQRHGKDGIHPTECRCVGYTENLTDAVEAIKEDGASGLHEGGFFKYIVIEQIRSGIYPVPPESEYWYKWSDDLGWCATEKPHELRQTVNFGIG